MPHLSAACDKVVLWLVDGVLDFDHSNKASFINLCKTKKKYSYNNDLFKKQNHFVKLNTVGEKRR